MSRAHLMSFVFSSSPAHRLPFFVSLAAAARVPAPLVSYSEPSEFIPNRYLVVLEDREALLNARAHAPRTVQFTHEWTIGSDFFGFAAELSEGQLDEVRMMPGVKYIEPDQYAYAWDAEAQPAKACKSQDLGSNGGGSRGGLWGLDRSDASPAYNDKYAYCEDGSNVDVYVIDTGVWRADGSDGSSPGHEDFEGRDKGGYCSPGQNDQHCLSDCQGHGTHVAGTVGGSTYGIAKNANIIGVRVLSCGGSGSYADIISGVEWVTQQTQASGKNSVSNMSLGGGANSALNAAVDASSNAGVVHVVAAGNSRADSCRFSPASASTAISVMATDNTDTMASFSNYGTCSEIGAPGVSVTSCRNAASGTATYSGTSMASPHVAGAAALIMQEKNSNCDYTCMREELAKKALKDVIKGNLGGAANHLMNTGASA
jgi:serine protease